MRRKRPPPGIATIGIATIMPCWLARFARAIAAPALTGPVKARTRAVLGGLLGRARGSMRFHLPQILIGILMAGVLAAPAAQAFTIENKDAAGQYAVPKFDLEEQAKNFRKDGAASSAGKSGFSTPLGNGTLEFGVIQGTASSFGSVFAPGLGPSDGARASRQEFDRRLAPPTSLEYNSVR